MKNKFLILSVLLATCFSSCKKAATSLDNNVENASTTEIPLTETPVVETPQIENTEDTTKVTKSTEMTFEKVEHNFGKIKQGDKVDYNFKFKNTGTADLIISSAKGSCGCTIPEYPKQAVKPGESGEIKVSFNSDGKSGEQSKTVSIFANTVKGTEILTIKASITK
ncbi:DUF1573 domain-containing protein [Flavobacterium sp.]|uniref:DUF1573 domain-containing protein n=1 Tax=Flavobacterium sp. TaxID=239 RepID=UPI003751AF36